MVIEIFNPRVLFRLDFNNLLCLAIAWFILLRRLMFLHLQPLFIFLLFLFEFTDRHLYGTLNVFVVSFVCCYPLANALFSLVPAQVVEHVPLVEVMIAKDLPFASLAELVFSLKSQGKFEILLLLFELLLSS